MMDIGVSRACRRRRRLLKVVATFALSSLLIAASATPHASASTAMPAGPLRGVLVRSFGEDGRAFVGLPPAEASSTFYAIEREPDGDLVLLAGVGSGRETVIERRGPQGALDPTFGNGGVTQVGARDDGGGGQPGSESGDLVRPVLHGEIDLAPASG